MIPFLEIQAQADQVTLNIPRGEWTSEFAIPSINFLDEKIWQQLTLENLRMASNFAAEQAMTAANGAFNAINYIQEKTRPPKIATRTLTEKILPNLLTEEEQEKIKETLMSTLKTLQETNSFIATRVGLPEDIMAGILISLSILGAQSVIPTLLRAFSRVPYAALYGAGAGALYLAGKHIPEVPVLASSIDISSVLNNIKDGVISANKMVSEKFGVSPAIPAIGGAALTAAGVLRLRDTVNTIMLVGRYGLYVVLLWPLLEYTFAFTREVYDRVNKAVLSKEEADALLKETQRLSDKAEEARKIFTQEESSIVNKAPKQLAQSEL